ncbi:digeranylgeranylglycerophospholipid reductase [Halolamina pelagica]|uniref:Digeranylgeranylglycerophospholipid reductase n=1 Tax=Halolamina pelagica TaxID=699431 RepID=A0A0P7GQD7_9EURY|nr:geranylgeranyl reductase family protein [Halolamina pelagica]KPN31380.1 digeranylgeranylglycerophospholipid reductase [Halolamina pelagica]
MSTHEYDIVVVGSGTSGCYAAATAAREGLDVAVVERKSEAEAGHIACGDALKGADSFPDAIPKSKIESSFTNTAVDHGRFEIPSEDTVLDIPVPGELAVIDRWEYGRKLIDGATEAGAEFHYDTVVNDVLQENGRVEGVRGKHKGEVEEFHAEITVDAAGALSVLQDNADFSDATFDTNVSYSQFCSAYREIVEVPEPVEWDDALVFKPTDRASGYLWYFPRTPTTINVGLGFQMTEEPMKLVQDLRNDLRSRPEFEGAEVKDKLGAALPTRRPYDSATAPGLVAVGDAAGLVNPTTGGGIAGAAYSGQYAAEEAIAAISNGRIDEELWRYNERVMDHFGARYAALDVYNVLSTAVEVDELTSMLASLPGEPIAEALYSGKTSISPGVALKTIRGAIGHLGQLWEIYQVRNLAEELLAHYESYPDRPSALPRWQDQRDSIMERVYEQTGADPKY